MRKKVLLAALFLSLLAGSFPAQAGTGTGTEKKRDPFVDLVDSSGRIKTEDELFQLPQQFIPASLVLKGIIWDKKRPLAVINGKVYGEGAVIMGGLVLEKINMTGIILRTPDNQKIEVELRKKKKERK